VSDILAPGEPVAVDVIGQVVLLTEVTLPEVVVETTLLDDDLILVDVTLPAKPVIEAYSEEVQIVEVVASLIGPVGPQGPAGPTGSTGPAGPTGPQGAASTVPGPKGDKGDTGAQGVPGEQGEQGNVGAQGDVGPIGPLGPQGPTGPIGPQGAKGDTGEQGATGTMGPQGPVGGMGPTGPQGPGIAEAPNDGQQYARQSLAWTVVAATPTGLGTLAYNDFTVNDIAPTGNVVGDRWVKPSTGEEMVWVLPGAWLNPSLAGAILEAPVDGKPYARKDAAWAQVTLANLTGIVTVPQGGSGVGTLTGLVKGNGTSAFTAAVAGTDYVAPSALTGYLPLTGGTLTGNMAIAPAAGNDAQTNLNAPAGKGALLYLQTAGKSRWAVNKNGVAETGSDVGGDFGIARFNDLGNYVDTPIFINRASGGVSTSALSVVNTVSIASGAATNAVLYLNAPTNFYNVIEAKKASVTHWQILPGTGDANSDFYISRFDNVGGYLGTPFTINRLTGAVTFTNGVTCSNGLTITYPQQLAVGSIELGGPSGAPFIDFHSAAGTNDYDCRIIGSGGTGTTGQGTLAYQANQHNIQGAMWCNNISTFDGVMTLNSALNIKNGSQLYLWNPANSIRRPIAVENDGTLDFINNAYTNAVATLSDAGIFSAYAGYRCRQGDGGAISSSKFNFYWTGALQVWIDTTNLGNMSISDERIKQRIKAMPSLTETQFHKIHPISYHWADVGIFKDDGKARWGFSAQNLLGIAPQMVQGDVDAVQENGDPQPACLEPLAILAQTVLQVQQLLKRIAALEAA